MESVDNSQFNPPNYFSREDQRPREHQRGYSKVCLRRVCCCFRCEPLSREISRISFFFFSLPLGIPRIPPRFANFSLSMMIPRRVLRGWRRYIHSGTIIFENDSCFDVLAFECIESNKIRRIKKLLTKVAEDRNENLFKFIYTSPRIQIIDVPLYLNSLLHLESSSANNKFL